MAIYKIWCALSQNIERDARYIETDLAQKDVADILVGFQFYIEEHTVYGSETGIEESTAQQLLCRHFGCKFSDRDAWIRYVNETGGKRVRKAGGLCSVDLFLERERRCGGDVEALMAPIAVIADTEFIEAVCAFFDDAKCLTAEFV